MPSLAMVKQGVFAVHDTGVPAGSDDFITLVVVHGFAWHADIFSRLLPFSKRNNFRAVLVNRRGYPGSAPLHEAELVELEAAQTNTSQAAELLSTHMKQSAHELHEFLQGLVATGGVTQKGGLVVVGWSFGTNWITALLAYAPTFPIENVSSVHVVPYIRRLVIYDPPYHALGYPPPSNFYNPLTDPSHGLGEGAALFPAWVSGYYAHGESASELEHRIALSDPRSTIATMSQQDIESAIYPPPTNPGGSDDLLMKVGIREGLFETLRKAVLFPPAQESTATVPSNDWSSVELRYVWCDQSVWEMPWGTWALQEELMNSKKSGKQTRALEIVRLRGANHFAHWDCPERALHAFLSDDVEGTRF